MVGGQRRRVRRWQYIQDRDGEHFDMSEYTQAAAWRRGGGWCASQRVSLLRALKREFGFTVSS
jgi:hypothetical protein